jgi:Protein of unknown function (DUF2723)
LTLRRGALDNVASFVTSDKPSAVSLWLPLRRPGLAWSAALLTVGTYLLGMARDLGFYDSGELALATVQLGLSHPPGQPLYTLLGFVFAKLSPFGALWGLNFLSALAGGLTLLPALSLTEGMLEPDAAEHVATPWLSCLALLVGAQHVALWEQATRIEVYALAVLLSLWGLARAAHLLDAGSKSRAAWGALGLSFGLAAAVNPVLAAFTCCAGLPALWRPFKTRALGPGHALALLAGGLTGLSVYLYVPLVAGRTDALVWGAPTSFGALLDYLGGKDFRTNLSVPVGVWLRQMAGWTAFSLEFKLLPLWGIGLVAHALTPPRGLTRLAAPIACVLAVAYIARYAHFVPEVPDYVSYVSVASWLSLAGCAALLSRLWKQVGRAAALGLGAVLIASVLLAQPAPFVRTRARDHTARAIAGALLQSAPPRAVLVAGSDHWVAPLWYLQEIEGQRPDVVVLASGLFSSTWYFEHVFRRHPDFARAPLRGPGGQLGRIARLLDGNAERPVLFEDAGLARALGLATCVGRFFVVARGACAPSGADDLNAAALWERLRAQIGEGEQTSLGVLASISYQRGLLLAAEGQVAAAVRTLLVPVAIEPADFALSHPLPYRGIAELPRWERAAPLGDPARNLYVAAELALSVGEPKQALHFMLMARERGLPEADRWLAAIAARAP